MQKIAILYQASTPPIIDGIKKPMKLGGYSDSGADIACELVKHEMAVITPINTPNIETDLDWVFPDTTEGIQHALAKGANVLWLNTVLYQNHPIEGFFGSAVEFIGQQPSQVELYDNKLVTNKLLKVNGISIPNHIVISKENGVNIPSDIHYPSIVKPIRGRGSQGVSFVRNEKELKATLNDVFSSDKYGSSVYIEEFLSGQEITITVMPAGTYRINNTPEEFDRPWCLPAVKRYNHVNEIAPYSGLVSVIENSSVLKQNEIQTPQIQDTYQQCQKAAELLKIKAPIRIDCRADADGKYHLFDLNLKPNMTGPSRPQRLQQDSLTLLAAKSIGWDYHQLLKNIFAQRWRTNL